MISRVLNVLSLDPGEINPRFVEHSDPLRNYQSYVGYLLGIIVTVPIFEVRQQRNHFRTVMVRTLVFLWPVLAELPTLDSQL